MGRQIARPYRPGFNGGGGGLNDSIDEIHIQDIEIRQDHNPYTPGNQLKFRKEV